MLSEDGAAKFSDHHIEITVWGGSAMLWLFREAKALSFL